MLCCSVSFCSVCEINLMFFSPSARPYAISEIITIVIVAVVLVVTVVGGIVACFVRVYGSPEGLELLLSEHFCRYSEDTHKFQYTAWRWMGLLLKLCLWHNVLHNPFWFFLYTTQERKLIRIYFNIKYSSVFRELSGDT